MFIYHCFKDRSCKNLSWYVSEYKFNLKLLSVCFLISCVLFTWIIYLITPLCGNQSFHLLFIFAWEPLIRCFITWDLKNHSLTLGMIVYIENKENAKSALTPWYLDYVNIFEIQKSAKNDGTPHFFTWNFFTKMTQNGLKWILNTTFGNVTFCRRDPP